MRTLRACMTKAWRWLDDRMSIPVPFPVIVFLFWCTSL